MPIYSYRCTGCGAELDKLQKLSDAPLTLCPECGKESLTKVLSANTGFCLMGHGWSRPGMQAGSTRK